MHSLQRKVLRTICPDQKGLIARITNICYKHELNIVQNNEFVDHRTGRFFMRTELEGIFNDATLLADLDSALPEGSIRELNPAGRRRVVILVTKEAHCLGDLLMKANYGGLDVDIAAVIGNHDTLRSLVERFGIPFELVSHEGAGSYVQDRAQAVIPAEMMLSMMNGLHQTILAHPDSPLSSGAVPAPSNYFSPI